MTTPTAGKTSTSKITSTKNGSSEPTSVAPSPTSPATANEPKKPVTVMLSEQLHRKVKITAELSGSSLSDLVEEQLRAVVKERLPGLLAALDADN